MENITEQIELARMARKNSCCQHSHYSVGTCLTTKNGRRYTGANIENAGLQSICGERCAFCKALSEGEKEFESIVVVGAQRSYEGALVVIFFILFKERLKAVRREHDNRRGSLEQVGRGLKTAVLTAEGDTD